MSASLGAWLGYRWGKLKYTIRNRPFIREYRRARDYWDTFEERETQEQQLDEYECR
jgi:hypothetical protein